MKTAKEYADLIMMPGWKYLDESVAKDGMEGTILHIQQEAYQAGQDNMKYRCLLLTQKLIELDTAIQKLPIKPLGGDNG